MGLINTEVHEPLISASKRHPCPICNGKKWCRFTSSIALCRFLSGGIERVDKLGSIFWLYILDSRTRERKATFEPLVQVECASATVLDKVYRSLNSKLSLSDIHRQKLTLRGFSKNEIETRKYKSFQLQGRYKIAKELLREFGEATCRTIPGLIIKTGDSGSYFTLAGAPGLLIPVRNIEQQIIGYKIRSDSEEHHERYSYFSSRSHGGVSPGCQIHVPIFNQAPRSMVRITEGELKSDLVTALSGLHTISIPGVTNWQMVMPVLAQMKVQNVIVALDQDMWTNTNVAQALFNLTKKLTENSIRWGIETWK